MDGTDLLPDGIQIKGKKMVNPIPQKLLDRGISPETAAMLSVRTFVSAGSNPDDQWVELPYFKNGVHVNSKIRTLTGEKSMRFLKSRSKGGELCVYNFDCLLDPSLKNEPLIITEGEIDTLSAIEGGYKRCISVPNGAPPANSKSESGSRYEYMDEVLPLIEDCKEIILATDDDGPGRALMNGLALRLGKSRCKWLKYPVNCNDLNETLDKYGVKGVKETIKRAKWVEIDGIYKLDDLPPVKEYTCQYLGWHLDDNFRLSKGTFSVITGIPGHGKTTFVNEIACRLVQKSNWKVAFSSFEQHPLKLHYKNLAGWLNRKPLKDQSTEEREVADHWIQNNFIFIVPGHRDIVSMEWLFEKMTTAVVRHDIDMIVIDPWNMVDHDYSGHANETKYIEYILKELRIFAERHDVHICIVAHPRKMDRAPNGEYEVPGLYDISGSKDWYCQCDYGLTVYRGEEGTEIHVIKLRDEENMGKPGKKFLLFNKKTYRFEEI